MRLVREVARVFDVRLVETRQHNHIASPGTITRSRITFYIHHAGMRPSSTNRYTRVVKYEPTPAQKQTNSSHNPFRRTEHFSGKPKLDLVLDLYPGIILG
jgi:hypothetical protein